MSEELLADAYRPLAEMLECVYGENDRACQCLQQALKLDNDNPKFI